MTENSKSIIQPKHFDKKQNRCCSRKSEPIMDNKELQKLREEIDAIDQELLSLLVRRFNCAVEIAKIKNKEGLALYDPSREAFILRQLGLKLGENESIFEIISVFESILSLSKKAQKKAIDASDK